LPVIFITLATVENRRDFEKMEIEKLPLGAFVSNLLGADIADKREVAARTQAALMVLDDYLKLDDSLKEDPTGFRQRADMLYSKIDQPERILAFLEKCGLSGVQLDEKVARARKIVDTGKGLGTNYIAVPPFGTILTNKKLGLISSDVMNACLLAQTAMRIDALFDGSQEAFPPAKVSPNDPPELWDLSERLNRLIEWRKEHKGPLTKAFSGSDYLAAARGGLLQAWGQLQAYPEAIAILDRAIEGLQDRLPRQDQSLIGRVSRTVRRNLNLG
jgi:hypothetical protein